jgi:hypothetical protein
MCNTHDVLMVISEAMMAQDLERITAVRGHFIVPNGHLSP